MTSSDVKKLSESLIENAWHRATERFAEVAENTTIRPHPASRMNDMPLGAPDHEEKYRQYLNDDPYLTYAKYLEEHLDSRFVPGAAARDEQPGKEPLSDLLTALKSQLTHIPMSPSKAADHQATYVIQQHDDTAAWEILRKQLEQGPREIPINRSTKRIGMFFDYWLTTAVHLAGRGTAGTSLDQAQTRYVVVGKPGIGKTAFLNYVFSVRAAELKRMKVIWVRVHVTGNRRERYRELETRLNSKFLRILCQFYLYRDSDFGEDFLDISLREHLEVQVKDRQDLEVLNDQERKALVQEYLDYLKFMVAEHRDGAKREVCYSDRFTTYLNDERGDVLTLIVMRFIQRKLKYAYIFILDGLDEVTIDHVHKSEFENWLSAVDAITDNLTSGRKAVYIISMRDHSYINFAPRALVDARTGKRSYALCRILPQPLELILEKRCARAVQEYNLQQPPSLTAAQFENALINLVHRVNMEIDPVTVPASQLSQETDRWDSVRTFSDLTNDNLRATMRFLNGLVEISHSILRPRHFKQLTEGPRSLESDESLGRRSWLLHRLLLHGSTTPSEYRNGVQYGLDGEMTFSGPRPMIPNIFNFRDFRSAQDSLLPKNLVKLRVIKYLEQKGGQSTKAECVRWLRSELGYQHEDLDYEIREMIHTGLLNPKVRMWQLVSRESKGRDDYNVELSKVASIILGKITKRCIYYETVIDDTPILSDFVELLAMRPCSRFELDLPLPDYLCAKSRSVIYFLFYLRELECNEIKRYPSERRSEMKDSLTLFDSDLIQTLKNDMARYIRGFLETKSKQAHEIRVFTDNWRATFDLS